MGAPILKSAAEIDAMRPAGRLVAQALELVGRMVAPGVITAEIDNAVEELFADAGGIPLFKGYPNPAPGRPDFPACICASINEEVVHGIPGNRKLREGDIFSVDVGVQVDGWCGDAARTFAVGSVSRKAEKLLRVTEECLECAIRVMQPGARLGQVSSAIQKHAEANGFSVVRKFVGHGIGREMHEPPQVPNYVTRLLGGKNTRLDAGTVLAIEPMVNVGGSDVRVRENGWTVITKDRTLSAHFEHTVAIGPDGPVILTRN